MGNYRVKVVLRHSKLIEVPDSYVGLRSRLRVAHSSEKFQMRSDRIVVDDQE